MPSLLHLFCNIDDFCQEALPRLQAHQLPTTGARRRKRSLCQSEIITILVAFHLLHFRNFKHFYLYLATHHRSDWLLIIAPNFPLW